MGFALIGYEEVLGVAAADSDLDAMGADVFSRRNDHYIFPDEYKLAGVFALGANITRARFNMPTWNAIARDQIWPVERSATIPDLPQWMDLRDSPMPIPRHEEMAIEASNDLGAGTESEKVFAWIVPREWSKRIPPGVRRLQLRATAAAVGVLDTWSGLFPIAFAENLRGGWYAVIGANVFDAGVVAFRFRFHQYTDSNRRPLRPGGLAQEAIGNSPFAPNMMGWGEWGRFHSYEPPEIEICANAAGASVQEIRLELVYLGESGGYAPRDY